MEFLKHAHSGLRWLVLVFLVVAIVSALMKWQSKAAHKKSDNMMPMLAMAFTHIQIVIGFVLYFMSQKVSFHEGWMKDGAARFYGMEHVLMMVIAVVLITIGYSRAKRQSDSGKKFKTIFTFYLIGLLLILAGIPWPFRAALGGGWF